MTILFKPQLSMALAINPTNLMFGECVRVCTNFSGVILVKVTKYYAPSRDLSDVGRNFLWCCMIRVIIKETRNLSKLICSSFIHPHVKLETIHTFKIYHINIIFIYEVFFLFSLHDLWIPLLSHPFCWTSYLTQVDH